MWRNASDRELVTALNLALLLEAQHLLDAIAPLHKPRPL